MHPMPTKPVMTMIAMPANLNFQYRSPALSFSLKERESSVGVAVVVTGGAAVDVAVGPGMGAAAGEIAAVWVAGVGTVFAFEVAFAFGLVDDGLETDLGGSAGDCEKGAWALDDAAAAPDACAAAVGGCEVDMIRY